MTLAEISNEDGRFGVFAIDHRDSMRTFLAPDDPFGLAAEDLTALKIELIDALIHLATGVMLEPEYSIPQVIDAGVLPDNVGFLAALESQGYLGDPGAAPTTILDGWSVEAAVASGAAGAKLLLPFHPDHPLAPAQEAVAREIQAECRRHEIPLILEPLFFGLEDPADRRRVVIETTRIFASADPDLLKLPFPVDPHHETDRAVWADACAEIDALCDVPWTLLSGGGSFEIYEEEIAIAVAAGCSGFMAGRALWGDAAKAPAEERAQVLAEVVEPRFRRLNALLEV